MLRVLGFAFAVLSLTAGCAPPSPALKTPAGASAPATDAALAGPTLPLEIHWVRNSAEYRAIFEQTFRLAGEAVARRSLGKAPGTWAVAVDADETLISNSLQSKERALAPPRPFEDSWDEWVKRREAPALPGAKAFLKTVHDLGGRIAVVTNRRDHHCQPTDDNLRALEIPFDVILCRTGTGDKKPRWRSVSDGTAAADLPPLEIVMWLGDNIRDFPGLDQELRAGDPEDFSGFGDRFFVLPNPLYGSWEGNSPE